MKLSEIVQDGGLLRSVEDLKESRRDLGLSEPDSSIHVGEKGDSAVEADESSEEEVGGIELGTD